MKVEIQLKYENTNFFFFKVHKSGGVFFHCLFFITFQRVSASDLCFWFCFGGGLSSFKLNHSLARGRAELAVL